MSDKVPYDKTLDSTLALMQEGYMFIKNRVDKYQSDIFKVRLMMQEVICMSGKEAAEVFYDPSKFRRYDAMPKRVLKTIFGQNAIQSMDGKAHMHRKLLFLSLMTPQHQQRLSEIVLEQWQASISKWEKRKQIVLFDEVKYILCKSACRFAGVPIRESEVCARTNDFTAMVYAFGTAGPRYWLGRKARIKAEKWIKGVIEDVRLGNLDVNKESPVYAMAFHKDINGKLLDTQTAAVELINILRPIVAISTSIVFSALAIYKHPECKEKLKLNNDNYLEMFAQEVRRYYPFTPFIGARVLNDFAFKNCLFKKGTLVLLDAYGTNHDVQVWKSPNKFIPERFVDRKGSLFDFIPQGGGDSANGHRCPGEGITVEVMKTSIDFLVNKIDYNVPVQNLSYNTSKIPTLPKTGFIMCNIKRK